MAEQLTLIQKLAKISQIADVVKKSKRGYNYSYADITEILAKVKAGMFKYGVTLIPQVKPETFNVGPYQIVKTKTTKTGEVYQDTKTEHLVEGEIVFRWVNNDDVEDYIEVPWAFTGSQEDPSQSFGSAITYSMRYFLTSYFQIAQSDTDVDAYRAKQKEAEEEEDRMINEEILNTLNSLIRNFLASNEDKKDDVKKLVSKYIKGGNYMNIKDPALSQKLLAEFKETFIG